MATAKKAAPAKAAAKKAPASKKAAGAQKAAGVRLSTFEGKDVLSTSVAITNVGDGLSNALAVDPVEMHVGETGIIALEYVVAKVRFDPIKDTPGLQRVHILRAGTATFIDEATVTDALAAQAERIEAASGVFHLPFGEGEKPDGMSDEEWEAQSRNTGDGDDGDDGDNSNE